MSAERSTESIIELLYGELSEEQEREVRAEMAESPDLQAEFDEFDMMLGRVRGVMPLEDVSPKIHASILEAARLAAEQPAEDRLIRRGAPEQKSFWKRVSSGQGSQIALVSAVLIAGLFVVRFVEKSDSPLHAPASDISAMREAAPAAPAMKAGAAVQDELAEGEAAAPPTEESMPAGGEAIADQWSPDNAPGDEANDDADGEGLAIGTTNEARARDSLRAELQRTQNLEKGRFDDAKSSADAPTPEPEADPMPARKPAPKKRSVAKTEAKPQPTQAQASNKSGKKLEESLNADVFGDSRGTGVTSTATPTVQGKSGLEYAAEAEEDASGGKQKEYRPSPGSISEVDTYFRRGDYSGAIRAADTFIGSGSGSKTETAGAMFIKAQSLAKLGRNQQAEDVLRNIQKNYPAFRSAEVNQQLSELQRKNAPKEQKRKAKPKMDKAAEQPAEYDSLLK